MSDEHTPPPPGAERTVMVTPEQMAAVQAEADARAAAAAAAEPETPPEIVEAEAALPDMRAVEPPPAVAAAFSGGRHGSLVGSHLNDMFEVVRFIAEGGMGEVYEGRNIASHERVAIKIILPQHAADEQFMAMFRREADALQRLGHDALVKYRTLAFDRTQQLNYLALEYVDGPQLSGILAGEPADPAMVRVVLRRLAAGLATAHDLGVVHRDLSPDNILLPDGDVARVKIIDFGIVKDTNPGGKTLVGDVFAGKFGYAAPEMFGKYGREIGPWTDIYSLALTVLAFARGAPIDMGITMADAFDARGKVPDLDWLAPQLVPVFTGMLEPDPQVRFRSMGQVIEALDAPLAAIGEALRTSFEPDLRDQMPAAAPGAPAGAPAFVRRDTAPPPSSPDKPKSKAPLFGGIAAAALLVLGAGGYFAFSGRPAATPAAAPGSDTAPPASTAAAPARTDWATAKPQALAALAGSACSALDIAGDPGPDGTIRLAGWHPATGGMPTASAGYRFDTSGVAAVPQPSNETCRILGTLRAAIPPGDAGGFGMTASQTASIAAAPAGASIPVNAGVTTPPAGKTHRLLVSIDDNPSSESGRIVAAPIGSGGVDPAALPLDKKPDRLLMVVLASATPLPSISAAADVAKLTAACSGGACAMTSGWVTITP